MEFSSTTTLKPQFPQILLSPTPTKHALTPHQWAPPPNPAKNNNSLSLITTKCGKNNAYNPGLGVELERELREIENQGRNWREMMNCKESTKTTTLEELLECLEREAIMGDDEGRQPNDYNRRAMIFDRSSRVFQALKLLRSSTQ